MTTYTIACRCGIVRHVGGSADPYRRCPVCGAEGREHWQRVSVPPETNLVGKEERAIGAIEFIEEEAEWTANDGGLTAAASDVLAMSAMAKKAIEEGNSHWVEWDDLFCAGTGAEQDIMEVVYNYFQ